jgi:hypothetical protein
MNRELENGESFNGIQKSQHGGRRAGAGRPPDPHSQRAICEQAGISPHKLRTARRLEERAVRVLGPAKGVALVDRVEIGELSIRQANRILDEAEWR